MPVIPLIAFAPLVAIVLANVVAAVDVFIVMWLLHLSRLVTYKVVVVAAVDAAAMKARAAAATS